MGTWYTQSHYVYLPYGQKFSKSAHDCRIFYAIDANFDADRGKKMTILQFLKSYTILSYDSRKIVVFMPVAYWYRYPTVPYASHLC